ncbi:MAG TPA: ABC transporter substrate-binding protein [Actinomycetota bacterium]|nr:ABC transporter substrate-binding protein [Actinomycetota bacterium]
MRRLLTSALSVIALAGACTSGDGDPLRVGAIYPLSGTQGPGGVDEYRGVQVAVDLVNEDGGVEGRAVRLVPIDVPSGDAAPAAIDELDAQGVELVLGSYGSTISQPAAIQARSRGMLFWETGAVGEMTSDGGGSSFFRVSPSGAVLGRNAVTFIADRYAPVIGRDPAELRWAVTLVDDAYGRAVAQGALDELERRGYPVAATIAYDPREPEMRGVVRELAAAEPDVLFASAYLEDAIAMRREMVRRAVDVLAGIGTSSSYCMPEFGQRLGEEAVGLFASDKPDSGALGTDGLSAEAVELLERADAAYRERFDASMSAAALAGFTGAWALLHHVLPEADGPTPAAVADAAGRVDLPRGSLPNGSGLRFGAPGTATAGANLLAESVIWQWTEPGEHWVVWPDRYATYEVEAIDPLP